MTSNIKIPTNQVFNAIIEYNRKYNILDSDYQTILNFTFFVYSWMLLLYDNKLFDEEFSYDKENNIVLKSINKKEYKLYRNINIKFLHDDSDNVSYSNNETLKKVILYLLDKKSLLSTTNLNELPLESLLTDKFSAISIAKKNKKKQLNDSDIKNATLKYLSINELGS